MVKSPINTQIEGEEREAIDTGGDKVGNNVWKVETEKVPFMEYSEQLGGKYRCTMHNMEFASRGTASRHLYGHYHNIDWDGKPIEEKKSKDNEKTPKDDEQTMGENEKTLKEIFGEDVNEENKDIGDEGFDIHKRKRAEAISRVLDNPYVQMFFVESRTFKVFPPSFDEGDIIREALEYLGNALGININVDYDPRRISDPILRDKVKVAARHWDKWNEEGEGGGS